MTLPIFDSAAASVFAPLVTFKWGASSVARYCRWTDDIVIGDETFISEPSFTWTFDTALGSGTDDSPLNLEMHMSRDPMNTLVLPYPHSKCEVTIEEVSPFDLSSRAEIFSGRASLATLRPSGKQGIAKLKIKGVKSRLEGDLGIMATTGCRWIFGNRNFSPCGVPLEDKIIEGTVAGLKYNGKATRVKIDFVGSPDLDNLRWSRGFVEHDGLKILIRKSIDDGTGRFELREMAPPYWDGAIVTLTPGCAKQLDNCRYWQNEGRFMAPGYAMPRRNPLFEE